MKLKDRLKKVSVLLAAGVSVIGLLVLFGWGFDIRFFRQPIQGVASMNPMTAVCFVLLGMSHLLLTSGRTRVAYAMSTFVIIFSLLRIFDISPYAGTGIDQLLFPNAFKAYASDLFPNRVTFIVALNFLVASTSILSLSTGPKRKFPLYQALSIFVLLVPGFSVLGYIYRVPEFYGAIPFLPMAIHTAVGFILFAIAILTAYPERGVTARIIVPLEGGITGRVLVVTTILLPVTIGYLRLIGHWNHYFSTEFGVALIIAVITLCMALLLWWNIGTLNERDEKRRIAEHALAGAHQELQASHEEITALNEEFSATNEELNASNDQLMALNDQLEEANTLITQQAQTILAQKDEQLNRVLDTTLDVIWSADLTGKGESFMSRSAEKIFDEPLAQLQSVATFWEKHIHPDDRSLIPQIKDYPAEGISTVFRIISSDKQIRWINMRAKVLRDAQGSPVRLDGILSDITEQRKAQDTIHEFRRNLDIIFTNTREGILLMDHEGRVILFNRSFQDFIKLVRGKEPEVGKYLWETTSEARREEARRLFDRAMQGEMVQTEAQFYTPQGEPIIHMLRYEPVRVNNRITHVCIVSNDITTEKEKENVLRKSEANFRAIFDSTEDFFVLIDNDLRVVTFNRPYGVFMQQQRQMEFREGTDFFDYVTVERKTFLRDMIKKAESGEAVRYETHLDSNGLRYWFRVSIIAVKTDVGNQIGYCIVSHNRTHEKQAELELRKSEERFRALVENGEDIIGLVDATGNPIYISPSVTKITGFAPEDSTSLFNESLVHPEDVEGFRKFVSTVIHSRDKLIDISYRTRYKEGWKWLEGTAMNLLDKDNVRGIVTNFRDITLRKRSEGEKNKLLEQLLDKNNNLLQFSFIASHNLRGPVASMIGLINLAKFSQAPLDASDLLRMMEKSAFKLDDVISDLSKVLQIEHSDVRAKEWVSIREIFDTIMHSLMAMINRYNIQLILDDHAIQEFYSIRSYLHSVLYNLISNAVKYRSSHRVTVIEVTTFRRGVSEGFYVKDNGEGVDLSLYGDKIFNLYQRFHPHIEGKGMGLFLARTQVLALNGAINVESKAGEGAVFTVTLPINNE